MPFITPDNNKRQDFTGKFSEGLCASDLSDKESNVPISYSDTGNPFDGAGISFSCTSLNTCSISNFGDVDDLGAIGTVLAVDATGTATEWITVGGGGFTCNDLNTCSIASLSDVGGIAPVDGQILVWNTTGGIYEPGDLLGTTTPATNLLNIDASGGLELTCTDVQGCVSVTADDQTGGNAPGTDPLLPTNAPTTIATQHLHKEIYDDYVYFMCTANGGGAWDIVKVPIGITSGHGVLQSTVVSDYNTTTDLGGTNRVGSPTEGEVNLETYNNGFLFEWYDGAAWQHYFMQSCCPDSTLVLTNPTLLPADPEAPTNGEVQTYVTTNGPYGAGTQITYTSPNSSYWTWIVDLSGTPIAHEVPGGDTGITSDDQTGSNAPGIDPTSPTNAPTTIETQHFHKEIYDDYIYLMVTANSGASWRVCKLSLTATDHGVTHTVVVGDYDTVGDPGGGSRTTTPVEGEVNLENYDNGALFEWYDGSVWHSYFLLSCCPDPTIALTNATLSPAAPESPTQGEIDAYIIANGPYGTGTQITYTSPNGLYWTWILDVAETAISHEDPTVAPLGCSDEGTITGIPTTVTTANKAYYIWDLNTLAGDVDLSTISTIVSVPDGSILVFRNTGENNILFDQDINGATATYIASGLGGTLKLCYDNGTYQVI